jgi:hypothetical protein
MCVKTMVLQLHMPDHISLGLMTGHLKMLQKDFQWLQGKGMARVFVWACTCASLWNPSPVILEKLLQIGLWNLYPSSAEHHL